MDILVFIIIVVATFVSAERILFRDEYDPVGSYLRREKKIKKERNRRKILHRQRYGFISGYFPSRRRGS